MHGLINIKLNYLGILVLKVIYSLFFSSISSQLKIKEALKITLIMSAFLGVGHPPPIFAGGIPDEICCVFILQFFLVESPLINAFI
jgi:hypothetical protein